MESDKKKVVVDCEWPEHRQAIERLVQFVLKASEERYGLGVFEDRPLRIEITIKSPPIPIRNLGIKGEDPFNIYWIRSSEKDPAPDEYMRSLTRQDYSTMIFGFLHEIGHSVFPDLIEDNHHPPELPESLYEAWATFFAWSLIPLVWKRLGENAWPIPHNYFAYEMNRKRKTIRNPQDLEDYYINAFFRIEEKSGETGICKIIEGLRQTQLDIIEVQKNALAVKELERVLKQIEGGPRAFEQD